MSIAKSVAGVCAVRDARDLIALTCGHYLRIGFGHIAFIDDGSSDGTFEMLSALSAIEPRVSVKRVTDVASYGQRELISSRANELVAGGFSIIVPFDADEFWNVDALELEARYAQVPEIVFKGRWVNFVQQRSAEYPTPFGLFRVKHRTRKVDGEQHGVSAYRQSFVSNVMTKAACKAASELAFDTGQHEVSKGGGPIDTEELEIFHLPLRYKCEITKRGLNYEPRRAPLRTAPNQGWQSRFHREVVLTDRVDEVWAANSADRRGALDCYGKRIKLIRDRRLQYVLLRSWLHLALRYRTNFLPS